MLNQREAIIELNKKFEESEKTKQELIDKVIVLEDKVEKLIKEKDVLKSDLISNWLLPIILILSYFYLNTPEGSALIENNYLNHTYTVILITIILPLFFIKDIVVSTKWKTKKILQKGLF